MELKQAVTILEVGGVGYTIEEFYEAKSMVNNAIERLEKYEKILGESKLIFDGEYCEYFHNDTTCYGAKSITNEATIKLGELEDIFEKSGGYSEWYNIRRKDR